MARGPQPPISSKAILLPARHRLDADVLALRTRPLPALSDRRVTRCGLPTPKTTSASASLRTTLLLHPLVKTMTTTMMMKTISAVIATMMQGVNNLGEHAIMSREKGGTPATKTSIEIWSKRKILLREVVMAETSTRFWSFLISQTIALVSNQNIYQNMLPYSANEIECKL
jgi:hypothetical protein